jgi:hypothetical protein
MIRISLRLLPVLTAATLISSTFATAEIAVKSGEKIAFLGDSITQGGWSNPAGYVQLVIAGLEANGIKAEPSPQASAVISRIKCSLGSTRMC